MMNRVKFLGGRPVQSGLCATLHTAKYQCIECAGRPSRPQDPTWQTTIKCQHNPFVGNSSLSAMELLAKHAVSFAFPKANFQRYYAFLDCHFFHFDRSELNGPACRRVANPITRFTFPPCLKITLQMSKSMENEWN
jgi:hypothetical protein